MNIISKLIEYQTVADGISEGGDEVIVVSDQARGPNSAPTSLPVESPEQIKREILQEEAKVARTERGLDSPDDETSPGSGITKREDAANKAHLEKFASDPEHQKWEAEQAAKAGSDQAKVAAYDRQADLNMLVGNDPRLDGLSEDDVEVASAYAHLRLLSTPEGRQDLINAGFDPSDPDMLEHYGDILEREKANTAALQDAAASAADSSAKAEVVAELVANMNVHPTRVSDFLYATAALVSDLYSVDLAALDPKSFQEFAYAAHEVKAEERRNWEDAVAKTELLNASSSIQDGLEVGFQSKPAVPIEAAAVDAQAKLAEVKAYLARRNETVVDVKRSVLGKAVAPERGEYERLVNGNAGRPKTVPRDRLPR